MSTSTDKNNSEHKGSHERSELGSFLRETEVKTDRSKGHRAKRPVLADLRQARWKAQDAVLSVITVSVLSSSFFFFFSGGPTPSHRPKLTDP